MDPTNQHYVMATQAATLVVVMVAFVFSRLKWLKGEDGLIVYGPRVIADEHRQKNLQLIYNSIDA